MVYHRTISPEVRAYIKFHRDAWETRTKKYGEKKKSLVQRLANKCKISVSKVYRLLKEPLDTVAVDGKSRKGIGGRKRKVSSRGEMHLLRNIHKIRMVHPNWTATELMSEAGITDVSVRTIQRILNHNKYYHLKARRKGLLSTDDLKKRLRFAKEMKREKTEEFWSEDIAFYFDGTGFVHKSRPKEHARSPNSKVWRKAGEGLSPCCTSKGAKTGHGGKQVKMFVAISSHRGVICAERYDVLNGESFAAFVRAMFSRIFARSGKTSMQWIQDGDPSQNSAKAKIEFQELDARLLQIPPRSPDLNPIENVFAFVKKELREQAIEGNIERETYEEFTLRVQATLYSVPPSRIDNIISSMGRRLTKIIIRKGGRIEY